MNCKATLTTSTPTDDVVAEAYVHQERARWTLAIPDGMAVVRDGDRLKRLDVPEHQCSLLDGHSHKHMCECGIAWPGAAIHADNTPPADVQYERYCNKCGYIGPDERHDGCQYAAWETDVPYTPPADVCPDCGGKGTVTPFTGVLPTPSRPCGECGGTGEVDDGAPSPIPVTVSPCPSCGGRGTLTRHVPFEKTWECSSCGGTGYRHLSWREIQGRLTGDRSAVTDAQVEAACNAQMDAWHGGLRPADAMRAALEAAAKERTIQ